MGTQYQPQRRGSSSAVEATVVLEGKLSQSCEALLMHIIARQWPDGSERPGSSLTIFEDEGALKGCLNDKGNDLVAFVSSSSLEGLLKALEAGLRDDKLDWRPSRASAASRKKRGA